MSWNVTPAYSACVAAFCSASHLWYQGSASGGGLRYTGFPFSSPGSLPMRNAHLMSKVQVGKSFCRAPSSNSWWDSSAGVGEKVSSDVFCCSLLYADLTSAVVRRDLTSPSDIFSTHVLWNTFLSLGTV